MFEKIYQLGICLLYNYNTDIFITVDLSSISYDVN